MTQKLNWFAVCYWSAAAVQVVGSYSIFGTVGGSPLHAIAGALCLELLILALNNYGASQSGKWLAFICSLSLALIAASAMLQVADLLSHQPDPELASRLGVGLYDVLRVTVPAMPSVAMGIVTLIKFKDGQSHQMPAPTSPDEQGEAFDPAQVLQTLEVRMDAKLAEFAQRHPTQAVQVNVQGPASQCAGPCKSASGTPCTACGCARAALADLQGRLQVYKWHLLNCKGGRWWRHCRC